MVELNYLALLVAAIACYAVGAFWYSPVLFGNTWMKAMGFDKKKMESMKKNMTQSYILMFVTTLVMVYVLAHFVLDGGAVLSSALETGFWIWLGFFATSLTGAVLWEGKPWSLYFVNAGYWLVNLLVASAIIAVWP